MEISENPYEDIRSQKNIGTKASGIEENSYSDPLLQSVSFSTGVIIFGSLTMVVSNTTTLYHRVSKEPSFFSVDE